MKLPCLAIALTLYEIALCKCNNFSTLVVFMKTGFNAFMNYSSKFLKCSVFFSCVSAFERVILKETLILCLEKCVRFMECSLYRLSAL